MCNFVAIMESDKRYKVIRVCATVCRFVLAIVFIFSGFVKSVDPLGTQYKIQEYIDTLSWAFVIPEFFSFLASVLLGMLEFCMGIYLFFGIRRIIAPRAIVLLMSFMTPLTLWIAINDSISDCGCFGDAIVLNNWETFGKNVVLLAMSILVLKWRKHIFPLVTIRLDWLIALYGFLYILGITIYSYVELPVFDFRPYHVGANIREGMEIPEGKQPTEYETRFILTKDGEEQEFTLDNYPDSTWTFVDAFTVVKKEGYEPPIRDFSIQRMEDGEDITEQVLTDTTYTFLLVSHQLALADDGAIDLMNELYDYSLEYGYSFYCLTSSSSEDVLKWQESTGAEYPFCEVDNITLKTMIRSNPGLMLIKDGVVVRKWSVNNFPDEYELGRPLDELSIGQTDFQSFVYKTIWVIVWFVFPLFLICAVDMTLKRYWNRMRELGDK